MEPEGLARRTDRTQLHDRGDRVRWSSQRRARQPNAARTWRCDEAFADAVRMLAAESTTVRAGGVYALERLLVREPTLHDAVVRTLAVFVRERSPARGEEEPGAAMDPLEELEGEPERPSDDVSAALRALARRPVRREVEKLDLSGTRFVWADLSDDEGLAGGARFAGVNLFGAELYRVDLSGADLSGAILSFADLRAGRVLKARMAAANLSSAKLDDVDLTDSDLRRAYLDGSSMMTSLLLTARLDGANMTGCDLRKAGLDGAVLDGARLNRSDMREADFWRTRLVGTRLGDVDLRGADLREADLTGADLEGTDLRGTDLSAALGLTREQLAQAKTDGETLLPDGL